MMNLRIHELIHECKKRNISLDNSSNYKSQDYIKLLSTYSLLQQYGNLDSVPFPVKYRYELQSPMLCKLFKDLKVEAQQEILKNKSGRWVAEYKYGGARSIMVYHPDSGFHFFSRHLNPDTFLSVDYTDKIFFIKNGKLTKPSYYKGKFPKAFVLDCEIVLPSHVNTSSFYLKKENIYYGDESNPVTYMLSQDEDFCYELQTTDYPLSIIVFDILYYDRDIQNVSFEKRKSVQEQLTSRLSKYGLPYYNSELFKNNFMDYFNNYILDGGEGFIFKNLDKPYLSNGGRHSDVQVKLKNNMIKYLSVEHDLDVWLSDCKIKKVGSRKTNDLEYTVSSISCSLYIKKPNGDEIEHKVCDISDIPLEVGRLMVSKNDDGYILKPEFKDKVLSITGFNMRPNMTFEYAFCNNWDFYKDKTKYDCIVSELSFMELCV